MMFLYSLLPSCSGHRLSGYLEVPENGHRMCLEQLYFLVCIAQYTVRLTYHKRYLVAINYTLHLQQV